jgi:hypothetical protein
MGITSIKDLEILKSDESCISNPEIRNIKLDDLI